MKKIEIEIEEIDGNVSIHMATTGTPDATHREKDYAHWISRAIAEVVIPRTSKELGAHEVIDLLKSKNS